MDSNPDSNPSAKDSNQDSRIHREYAWYAWFEGTVQSTLVCALYTNINISRCFSIINIVVWLIIRIKQYIVIKWHFICESVIFMIKYINKHLIY